MKYMIALVLLGTFVFAADNNLSQKKPVKKTYPRGTISTH